MVRHLLARRLGTAPERILLSHDLQRDLGLDPLDLVLTALDLEEIEGEEFPIASLETIRTVEDFARLARTWQKTRGADARTVRPLPASVRILRRRLRRATREWREEDARLARCR